MTQNTSGGSIANGEKSVGSDSNLTNENQQKISKRDSIADIWGHRTPYIDDWHWPVRIDEQV